MELRGLKADVLLLSHLNTPKNFTTQTLVAREKRESSIYER